MSSPSLLVFRRRGSCRHAMSNLRFKCLQRVSELQSSCMTAAAPTPTHRTMRVSIVGIGKLWERSAKDPTTFLNQALSLKRWPKGGSR